jgi:hypothetical protein
MGCCFTTGLKPGRPKRPGFRKTRFQVEQVSRAVVERLLGRKKMGE